MLAYGLGSKLTYSKESEALTEPYPKSGYQIPVYDECMFTTSGQTTKRKVGVKTFVEKAVVNDP
jgi:hypothetical protein